MRCICELPTGGRGAGNLSLVHNWSQDDQLVSDMLVQTQAHMAQGLKAHHLACEVMKYGTLHQLVHKENEQLDLMTDYPK